MKIQYADTAIHGPTKTLLENIIPIVESYADNGYHMTVRQLYYQLVAKNIIPNMISSYQRVSKAITTGRMNGMIDWEHIVDRVRVPMMPNQFDTISSFVRAIKDAYRTYRWSDQEHYIEVMVEKEALAGILEPVTRRYHVSLLVNKGYASASAMHDVSIRMREQEDEGKECHILYMGDHDPSGIDMVRDIQDRMNRFDQEVDVQRIALTKEQIEDHNLPPNPAKKSDPRSKQYYEEHGSESWELDALNPEVLTGILTCNIEAYLDLKKYTAMMDKEDTEIDALDKMTSKLET